MTTSLALLAIFDKIERGIAEGRKALDKYRNALKNDDATPREVLLAKRKCFYWSSNILSETDEPGLAVLGIHNDCVRICMKANDADDIGDSEGILNSIEEHFRFVELAMQSHLSDTPLQA